MLIRFLSFFIVFNIAVHSSAEACDPGFRYDDELKRCVLKESTVDSKTNSLNCERFKGEAYRLSLIHI